MTVKLLLLKSGEDIISDIQEMVVEDPNTEQKRVIGYFLTKPCVVKLRDASLAAEQSIKKENSYNVTMYPWIPLSKEKVIPLTAEWVITMVTPADQVKKMYEEDILPDGKTNQDSTIDQQPDSDNSD
jgi:hypothetical protein